MSVELSIIVPTFNESLNLPLLIAKVESALRGRSWEMIIVDDNSPDGTYQLAKQFAFKDERIRCIRRINRRGLAGACIEGILSSSAPFVAVMDADLQHDESLLPKMLDKLSKNDLDIIIGSRYVDNGNANTGFSKKRATMSLIASAIAKKLLKVKFNDLMSGFFMLRRDKFDEVATNLSTSGFKILLDIAVTSGPNFKSEEMGFTFRQRISGESKLDAMVMFDFIGLVLNKATNGLVPIRFAVFGIVGAIGVAVHMVSMYFLLLIFGLRFAGAQFLATMIAMTSNYFVNNYVTYRDAKIPTDKILSGLFRFYLVCMAGAIANLSIAEIVYQMMPNWILASLLGVIMGSIWNYALSSLFVWNTNSTKTSTTSALIGGSIQLAASHLPNSKLADIS